MSTPSAVGRALPHVWWSRLIVVVVALVLVVAVPSVDASPTRGAAVDPSVMVEYPEPTVVVLHWNVGGGGRLHFGRVDTGMTESVAEWIVESNATVVALNEICRPQFDDIMERLVRAGWIPTAIDHGRFGALRNTTCMRDGITPYGNALLARVPLGLERIVQLPQPTLRGRTIIPGSREWRNVLCADELGTRRMFCTTHITTDPVFRDLQLQRTAAFARRLIDEGWTPILAGDFNAMRPRLGMFMQDFAHLFVPGMGVRVDHVFVPRPAMSGLWAFEPELAPSTCVDVLSGDVERPCSDHPRVRVRVALLPGL